MQALPTSRSATIRANVRARSGSYSQQPTGTVGTARLAREASAASAALSGLGTAPAICGWRIDRVAYAAVPLLSDGSEGAPLELRGLFEQFFNEVAPRA